MTEQGDGGLRTVVITGSTRGIGYGLADAFLAQGCQVVVSGRTLDKVTAAIDRLVRSRGFELKSHRKTRIWHVAVYGRAGSPAS